MNSPLLKIVPSNRLMIPSTSLLLALGIIGTMLLSSARLAAEPSKGGDFSLIGGVVSGGGTVTGGGFTLEGSAGTPNAGESTGSDFVLTGGLIGVYAVPGDVELGLDRTEDGLVHLKWPATATGYVLESTTQLGQNAVWTPVNPAPKDNTLTVPFDQPARFYRLRKP